MSAQTEPAKHSPLGLYATAGLVLLGEYLLVSVCFDVQPVAARGGIWSLFSHAGTAALIGFLICIALIFLRPATQQAVARTGSKLRVRMLGLHAGLYAAFIGLTWVMLGYPESPTGPAALWLSAWIAIGASSTAALLLAMFQFRIGKPRLVFGIGVFACIFGVLAWNAGLLAEGLWDPLSQSTLSAAAAVLDVLVPGAVRLPGGLVLELADFAVDIDRTCSGFEGMGLAAVLTVAYWWTFRRDLRFPNAFLLLPISVALSWIGNVVRIVSLMLLGAFVNPDLAVGGFHSKAGWVMFCAIALTVGGLGRRLRFFSCTASNVHEPSHNPTAAYLMPLLAALATALVTGMFVTTFDQLYGLRIVAAVCVLYAYRKYYSDLQLQWSWLSVFAGVLIAVAWIGIPGPQADAAHVQALAEHATIGWISVRALGFATIVPICEELAFRGYLLRRLVARDFTLVSLRTFAPFAILISSLAFGFLHERWAIASCAGAVYALVQIRTGRIWDAVVAHGVTNAILAIWVVASGDFAQWV